jgi:hypothetical protein
MLFTGHPCRKIQLHSAASCTPPTHSTRQLLPAEHTKADALGSTAAVTAAAAAGHCFAAHGVTHCQVQQSTGTLAGILGWQRALEAVHVERDCLLRLQLQGAGPQGALQAPGVQEGRDLFSSCRCKAATQRRRYSQVGP